MKQATVLGSLVGPQQPLSARPARLQVHTYCLLWARKYKDRTYFGRFGATGMQPEAAVRADTLLYPRMGPE